MARDLNHRTVHVDHLRKGEDVLVSNSLIAGSLSGLIARSVIAPLDTLKIRLQIVPLEQQQKQASKITSVARYQSRSLMMIKQMIQKEGIRSFWKGNVPGSAMYIVYGGVQFGSYSLYNNILGSKMSWNAQLNGLFIGALAGMSSSFCSYPFDVLRTRFVANRTLQSSNINLKIQEIWTHEGVQGFFRGCSWSMFTISLSASILFGCYETLKVYGESHDNKFILGSASSISGVLSKVVVFPLDTIRRRIQLRSAASLQDVVNSEHMVETYKKYHGMGFIQMGNYILRQEGLASLYRGVTMALCKSVPSTIVSLWSYEAVLRLLPSSNN
ncbi:thiamine transporter TPC1 NDAI_0G01240 [Naumovozyma dairenensis CBS 421]|uniref:Mitochondrial thiamine pyrophosphate carrier 1 n=1 Tax=Naumovozyma dairenensis (strain ATCC 10597 / BCRC 20456 / CBS 421 / NBRC 0211 / NRRL Y-12639) TaxID=1071378 RepID=G0WDN9_NAUDC|nr:hypothetical protein NDAI_0G01240 [Naumovozyma dairenensis CBS 421]CCD25900.2 hypothetical protein NDAI_0G01240 [Naumovozyma dairenensis CBS 421]